MFLIKKIIIAAVLGLCASCGFCFQYSGGGGGGGGSSQWTTSGSSIYYNSGRVGIGTSTFNAGNASASKLDIEAGNMDFTDSAFSNPFTSYAPTNSILRIQNQNGSTGGINLKSWTNSGGQDSFYLKGAMGTTTAGDTSSAFVIDGASLNSGTGADADALSTQSLLSIRNNTNVKMTVLGNGNVGIGTATPSSKLHMSSGTLAVDGSGAAATISGTVTANLFSGPLKGTATNDSACAGCVGEIISSTTNSGHTVSLSNATPANVVSMSLTAGDWDVTGVVDYVTSGATTSDFKSGASAVSATFGAQDTFLNLPLIGTALSDTIGHPTPVAQASLLVTTTIYLIGQANFSVGSATAYGTIRARRTR